MNERTSIVNVSGDHEETIVQLARHLGTNKIRRKLFRVVYGRGAKPRSKRQIMIEAGIQDSGANAQQVQNELDHLSKHHLIVKVENNGSVKDGSRNLYQKDQSVRANREEIIRLADNPKAADRIPTKRRFIVRGELATRGVTRRTLRARRRLSVLYLSASPDPDAPLRVDAETRLVQEAIRGSRYRDNVTVHYSPAANIGSLLNGLNDHRPQIVHFSGHGSDDAISADTGSVSAPTIEAIDFDLLAKALAATDVPPSVIVLNSCKSIGAAKRLAKPGRVLVVMSASISDVAAASFATRFYAAIASGQSIKAAFDQGVVAIGAASIDEVDTPQLLFDSTIDPTKMVLT